MIRYTFLFFLALLCACATAEVGRKYDVSASQKIEIGKTTEAEVISLLGSPVRDKTYPDGSKKYGYVYIKSKAHALPFAAHGKASGDKIVITFNPQGVVTAIDRVSLPGD